MNMKQGMNILLAVAIVLSLSTGYALHAFAEDRHLGSINESDILAAAQSRLDTFYADIPNIEISGTTYYIANDGNDNDDGLSPDTAWASLGRAFETRWSLTRNLFQPGDAIMLECGGIWYISPDDIEGLTSDAYNIPEGVILGAYGNGPRPVIRGDIPQANEPGFWTLYHDEHGIKIWETTEKLQDSNVIVFNGGQAYAQEIMPQWSTALNGYCNTAGEPFDIVTELHEDLTFCSILELGDHEVGSDLSNPVHTGTLYLRCDQGNPAEIYDEVAVPQAQTGFILHTNSTVTGLDIRYFTCIAATMDGYGGDNGQAIENCEVSWCGGLFHHFQAHDERPDDVWAPYCGGGALQVSGSGNSVKNCYIHNCGPMTLICTIHANGPGLHTFKDMTYSGNLIECSGTALHIADLSKMDDAGAEGFISNLAFFDNIVMHSGEGWIGGHILQIAEKHSGFFSAVENFMGAANNDGIYITDNVFYLSKANLLCLTDRLWNDTGRVNQPMVFSGNVYVQPEGEPLCVFNWEKGWGAGYSPDNDEFLSFINDDSGVVITTSMEEMQ